MRVQVTWETDDAGSYFLPEEVDVPDDVEEDDVAEYLSTQYGWLVAGWNKKEDG